jgi:glycosyltransferase involved in cell wall biosynthesis
MSTRSDVKIAFVTQPWGNAGSFSEGSSSISTLTYQIARRLAQSHEVLLYGSWARRQGGRQDHDGIRYRRISTAAEEIWIKGITLLDLILNLRSPRRPFFSSSLYYLGFALQAAFDLRRQGCDIVHIHNFSQFVPLIRALNPDVKIVLHMHCEWLTQLDRSTVERRLQKADFVLGCSDYITHGIQQRFPQLANRCHSVYNGVEVETFTRRPRLNGEKQDMPLRILYVGRVSPEKGVHILLDAFGSIAEDHPHVQLDVIGPAKLLAYSLNIALSKDVKVARLRRFYGRTLTERFENQVIGRRGSYPRRLQAGLSKHAASRVRFHGCVPHVQLADYYRKADIFVFPSVWDEPFGMPIVEAMACGVPVVATRGGGITEIVEDGRTGLLVERDDADALCAAILYLLRHEETRAAMGEAARRRVVEHFSWERIVDDVQRTYERLLSNHGDFSQHALSIQAVD